MAADSTAQMFSDIMGSVARLAPALERMAQVVQIVAGSFHKATAGMLAFVQVADPGVAYQWNQAMTNLSGVIGQMFAPVIASVVPLIRQFVDWLYRLPVSAKAVIAAIGVASAVVVAGVGAMTVAMMAFNVASGGILPILGVIVTAVAGLAAGAGVAAAAYGYLGDVFKQFQKTMDAAWQLVGPLLQAAWQNIAQPVLAAFAAAIQHAGTYFKQFWEPMKEGVVTILAAFQTLAPEIETLSDLLKEGLVAAADAVMQAFLILAKAISGVIDYTMKAVIAATVIFKHGVKGLLTDSAAVFDEINKKLAEHEKKKEKVRFDLDKGAKEKKGPGAPDFGKMSEMADIAGAKELYWKAALEASTVAPQIKAINDVEQKIDLGNKILEEINKKFGIGGPIGAPAVGQ